MDKFNCLKCNLNHNKPVCICENCIIDLIIMFKFSYIWTFANTWCSFMNDMKIKCKNCNNYLENNFHSIKNKNNKIIEICPECKDNITKYYDLNGKIIILYSKKKRIK